MSFVKMRKRDVFLYAIIFTLGMGTVMMLFEILRMALIALLMLNYNEMPII